MEIIYFNTLNFESVDGLEEYKAPIANQQLVVFKELEEKTIFIIRCTSVLRHIAFLILLFKGYQNVQ